jgi:CRISPR-associated protein Csx17
MTLHLHHLTGCAPTPLAFYLKGLGVFRILAEQRDPTVRGWWEDEHFCLLTEIERLEIERFLLRDYAPTPFVSPWNKGSGFYGKEDPALSAIESSVAPRFERFRSGIDAARRPLAALAAADAAVRALKDQTKKKRGMKAAEAQAARALRDDDEFRQKLTEANKHFEQLKSDLFRPCLLSWRGAHRRWLDAAVVWLDEERRAWPALLGTGGNDARLDFTNNAMQRLGDLFDLASPSGHEKPGASELLDQSLWGTPCDKLLEGAAIGQFLPGSAGGANSTSGPEGDSLVNPWDFVLMLEGAVLFSARATRRLDGSAISRASAPFAVRSHPIGHGTPGREKSERGEQWMPLWGQPASLTDIRTLLGEARVQLGRQVANRPLDVARAVSRLGVARGITGFVRFGYLERNGQAKIAVPLGRVDVRERPRSRLIDDLAPWLDRVQRAARRENAPARLALAEGRLADTVFAALTHDDSPDRWQSVLLAAVAVEGVQVTGSGIEAGPIPPLGPEWLAATADGSPTWRLARALGSAAAGYDRGGRPHDSVRRHWLPLAPDARRFRLHEGQLARDPGVVATGRNAVADLAALVERRLIEAAQEGSRHLSLAAARGCDAHPADLALLLAGEVNLARLSALARAFMAIRWERWRPSHAEPVPKGSWPDEAWMALRLAHLPWPLEDGRAIRTDETIIRRLRAGDGAAAVDTALQRLRAAGLRPPLYGGCADPATAYLWAAALALPVSRASAGSMATYFESENQKEFR